MSLTCADVTSSVALIQQDLNGALIIPGQGGIPQDCCNLFTLASYDPNGIYTFVAGSCMYQQGSVVDPNQPPPQFCEISNLYEVTCVNANNFSSWNDYYTIINGQSLYDVNPISWSTMLDYVNNGNSFYSLNATAEIVSDETCCQTIALLGGNAVYTLYGGQFGFPICQCNSLNPQPPPPSCPVGTLSDVVCVNISNFQVWNTSYTQINGQSIQQSDPILWGLIINFINAGNSFYAVAATARIVQDQSCCDKIVMLGGDAAFTASNDFDVCKCNQVIISPPPPPPSEPSCPVNNVNDVVCINQNNFQSWYNNYGIVIEQNNPSLWSILINNYINTNSSFSVLASTGDVVQSQSCCSRIAELGFNVSFSPSEKICRCNPEITPPPPPPPSPVISATTVVIDYTLCDLTDVEVVNSFDIFNNAIQIVVEKDTTIPVSEACCNKLRDENNFPWIWSDPYCLVNNQSGCLPIKIELNENLIITKPCASEIEISMWLYFGTPSNPCIEIPNIGSGFGSLPSPETGDTTGLIVVTDNTGAIEPGPITSGGTLIVTGDDTAGLGFSGKKFIGDGFNNLPTSGFSKTMDNDGNTEIPKKPITPTGGSIEDGTLRIVSFNDRTKSNQNGNKTMTENNKSGFGGKNLLIYNKDYTSVTQDKNNKC